MTAHFAHKYRVDTVPFLLKPLYHLYGYGCGLLLWLYLRLCHTTCRVTFEGTATLNRAQNFIYCCWHDSWLGVFVAFPKFQKHIWLNHPYWYMRPVHVMGRLCGIERLILGSTGHDGKIAAAHLVNVLKQGYSTFMLPDGPNGPPQQLRKGILHISQQSRVPIVPLRFAVQGCWTRHSWDRRKIPIPFLTKLRVTIGNPLTVTSDNFDDVLAAVPRGL